MHDEVSIKSSFLADDGFGDVGKQRCIVLQTIFKISRTFSKNKNGLQKIFEQKKGSTAARRQRDVSLLFSLM